MTSFPPSLIRRAVLNPCRLPEIKECYDAQEAKFWRAKEVLYETDADDFQHMLTDRERKLINFTLAFFANSDQMVFGNLMDRLIQEIDDPWIRGMWQYQAMMEFIHAQAYNDMIDICNKNDLQKKMDLFRALETSPEVQAKLRWCQQLIESQASLAERVVCWAFVEGVFFATSFATLMWLRTRGLLKGVTFANEKIVEDESLHVKGGALVYHALVEGRIEGVSCDPVSRERMYEIAREVVAIESQFAADIMPDNLKGMNQAMMKDYVCTTADIVLDLLHVKPLFNKPNPFPFMAKLGLLKKANFFEKVVAEYQLVGKETEIRSLTVDDDDDF